MEERANLLTMADTMEVAEASKTQSRDNEIEKLLKILEIIISKLGDGRIAALTKDTSLGIVDIDLSDELSGVLMTVFTCLRKEENDTAGHLKYKAYIAKVQGVDIAIQAIVEEVKSKKIELDFLVATPIVELMTLFKGLFDEVRTGVTRFRVRASVGKRSVKRDSSGRPVAWGSDNKEMTQSISQYGLINHHIPLLQGITLAPERRTGVVRSLGPLTQAILLVMEDKYHTKLSSALLNSLQMLPMAQEIVNCLKEARSPGSVAGILKELGDILLLTTARSTQKIYMPLLLIRLMWSRKTEEINWSFSGAPMMKMYTALATGGLRFRIKTGCDVLRTSEVIFHSMFGTYLEDLNILSQITTHAKWHQRKDLNTVFNKRAAQNAAIVSPIKFKYVSKMAQSLMIKSLGNIDPVATSRPSFSGFRKRTFTQEFLTYLTTGKASHSFSNDPMQLQFALKKTKDSLVEDKDSIKLLEAGTKAWEEIKDGVWVESNFVPVEGGLKFYGTNN